MKDNPMSEDPMAPFLAPFDQIEKGVKRDADRMGKLLDHFLDAIFGPVGRGGLPKEAGGYRPKGVLPPFF